MQEPELRITRTHSADEFEGSLFGKWIALTLVAGLAIFAGLFYGCGCDFMGAAMWSALPVAVCFIYLRFCHQGKPPGYIADLFDSLLTGGHARPSHWKQPSPRDHD
jgi:hypothetical protein